MILTGRSRQKSVVLGIAIAVFFIGLLIFIFLYFPLMKELKVLGLQCRQIEADAALTPSRLQALRMQHFGRGLISEKEVPVAVNELTRRGNLKGVEFVSLASREIQKVEGKPFRILPIEAELRSSYSRLGEFLGALDELEKSLMTVGDFTVTPDKESPDKVRARVTLQMHLIE